MWRAKHSEITTQTLRSREVGSHTPPRMLAVRGFTLLEVLISLSLLSIILFAIHQSFASSVHVQIATRDLWRAMRYANNELVGYERGESPDVAVSQGEFPTDHPLAHYSWQREVLMDEPLPGILVKKVIFKLEWDTGTGTQSYTAETYVKP